MHFVTDTMLQTWGEQLAVALAQDRCAVSRENKYIDSSFPFRAIHMGKKNDEHFLDIENQRIPNPKLSQDLNLLVIKQYHGSQDLSFEDKQAKRATSWADLYIKHSKVEIVIELEVFKDKPFSNLIFIPSVCGSERTLPLHVIQVFAPERNDLEAQLSRRIGHWLMKQSGVCLFDYIALDMAPSPKGIRYLLPKKRAPKPPKYQLDGDEAELQQYTRDFGEQLLIPAIRRILASISS